MGVGRKSWYDEKKISELYHLSLTYLKSVLDDNQGKFSKSQKIDVAKLMANRYGPREPVVAIDNSKHQHFSNIKLEGKEVGELVTDFNSRISEAIRG